MEIRDSDDCMKVIIETAVNPLDFVESDISISTGGTVKASFSCKPCNLNFVNSQEFMKHNKEHDQNKFECPICCSEFRRRDHMRRHLRTVHSVGTPSFCPICSQDCKDQNTLTQHLRDCHPHENHYQCSECPYNTDNLQSFEYHKKIHIVYADKYLCDLCDAVFKRQDHLNRHKKSLHLKELVKCEICTQTFKRRDHMLRHVREQHYRNLQEKKFKY